ncbi:glutathione S-transferase [Mycena galericulata]|nr:glutathione S-transferase [Mycena galericulata]
MVLKFYGVPYAGGGGAVVAMVLAEKQIPFELIPVDLAAGEQKKPEFIENLSPFGQVPCIDDDGFIVYESRAIARYLAEKYADQGPALIPTDLKKRAMFEQAAAVESANFHPQITKVLMEKLGKPRKGQPVDEVALAEYLAEFSKTLQVYEKILGKQKFLAGDELTLADIFHLSFAPRLAPQAGIDLMTSTGPNIARWWNDLISRPTWVKLSTEGVQSTHI